MFNSFSNRNRLFPQNVLYTYIRVSELSCVIEMTSKEKQGKKNMMIKNHILFRYIYLLRLKIIKKKHHPQNHQSKSHSNNKTTIDEEKKERMKKIQF